MLIIDRTRPHMADATRWVLHNFRFWLTCYEAEQYVIVRDDETPRPQ